MKSIKQQLQILKENCDNLKEECDNKIGKEQLNAKIKSVGLIKLESNIVLIIMA